MKSKLVTLVLPGTYNKNTKWLFYVVKKKSNCILEALSYDVAVTIANQW